jgi:DNA-binding CsgD family transcriptional regulator
MAVGLTAKQRRELEHLVARATESAQVIRRAHVVLWSADGVAGADIARRLQLSAEAVSRIRAGFSPAASPASPRGRKAGARITPSPRRRSSA